MTTGLKESKGWPPERRAAQAAHIRARKPWLRSTGPRTRAGKNACRMNGLRHGLRSAKMQTLRKVLAAQRRFVCLYRAGKYHPPRRRLRFSAKAGSGAIYLTETRPGHYKDPHFRNILQDKRQ